MIDTIQGEPEPRPIARIRDSHVDVVARMLRLRLGPDVNVETHWPEEREAGQ